MKHTIVIVAALISCCLVPARGADGPPETYEGAVSEVYGFLAAMPITFEWCREKAPEIRQSLDEAEKSWREHHGALMADLEQRLLDIINRSDEFPPAARANVLPEIVKALDRMFRMKMAELPDEKARANCMLLPAALSGDTFAVEAKYGKHLELIRAWKEPVPAAAPGSAPAPATAP